GRGARRADRGARGRPRPGRAARRAFAPPGADPSRPRSPRPDPRRRSTPGPRDRPRSAGRPGTPRRRGAGSIEPPRGRGTPAARAWTRRRTGVGAASSPCRRGPPRGRRGRRGSPRPPPTEARDGTPAASGAPGGPRPGTARGRGRAWRSRRGLGVSTVSRAVRDRTCRSPTVSNVDRRLLTVPAQCEASLLYPNSPRTRELSTTRMGSLPHPRPETVSMTGATPIRGRSILVVDDEMAIRRALKARFEDEGAVAESAEDIQ